MPSGLMVFQGLTEDDALVKQAWLAKRVETMREMDAFQVPSQLRGVFLYEMSVASKFPTPGRILRVLQALHAASRGLPPWMVR